MVTELRQVKKLLQQVNSQMSIYIREEKKVSGTSYRQIEELLRDIFELQHEAVVQLEFLQRFKPGE